MGKASSSKKIKRVQAAGVSRTAGQRRNLGFPAMIAGIVLVGLVAVFFARDHRRSQVAEAPVANQDHWHAAFGIEICGAFEKNPADAKADASGIHTHSDGLIHIHPYTAAAAGKNATFAVFADQIGLELGDGSFTLPDGKTWKNGDKCTDEKTKKSTEGRVAMFVWPPQSTDKTEPKEITKNLGDIRFAQDGQAFVLAFLPKGEAPLLPPSMPELANPSDLDQPSEQGSTEFTTTVPGAETTTVPGAETTTVPGAETTTVPSVPASDPETTTTTPPTGG